MIKKVMVNLSVLVLFLFLVGCLDYKAYELEQQEDNDLLDEIAAIEEELGIEEGEEGLEELEEIGEEVVLPELGETPEEFVSEEELQVITIKENELVKLNIKTSDPDQDTVTHTFSKPLNNLGQWQTNYGDAGEYIVTITASDGKLTTEKRVKIMVERVNVPPVIELLNDLFVKEGQTVTLDPKVNDPNGDPVSVTITEPLKSGTFVTDHTSAGEYNVRVMASDGELSSEKSFKLVVDDVNMLPEINDLTDVNVQEGETITIKPTITDLDEDKIALTISDPVGDDGVWETGYTDHGNFVVTVTADDGKDKVSKQVSVTIEDVNMPPEIVDVYLDLN